MARDVSNNFLESVLAQETSKTFHTLLTVTLMRDDGLLFEGRYVDGYLPVESRGEIYQPAAFKLNIGSDISDTIPRTSLQFDSGDRDFIRMLRNNRDTPTIKMEVVMSDTPDFVEIGPVEFIAEGFTIKATSVDVDLTVEPVLNEPVPSAKFTPTLFPGLWGNIS